MLKLDKKLQYLLACSYGPDSMGLFQMLLEEGYSFSVAHVNYHLRKEADEETKNLFDYCNKNNITIFYKDFTEKIEKNVEERCREIRYQFFADIVLNNPQYEAVLVAHHQDDLLETYLLQKQRKILPSYYGLKKETSIYGVKIIRPLLSYKKSDLLDFCKENHVPYGLDSTNFLDIYSRNKIRHEVVEKMDDVARKNLLEEINSKNKEIEEQQILLSSLHDLSNKEILSLSPILFRLYLNKLAKEVVEDFEVSQKASNEIRRVLTSDKPNIEVPISKDIYFYKEYQTCFFDYVNRKFDFFYILEEPTVLDTPYFHLDFTEDSKNRNVTINDYPLVIRNAKGEDVVSINNYKVKVRRLFIDWKMPSSLRKRWPIILNKDNEVLYIPRYQQDFIPDDKCNFYVTKRFSLKK